VTPRYTVDPRDLELSGGRSLFVGTVPAYPSDADPQEEAAWVELRVSADAHPPYAIGVDCYDDTGTAVDVDNEGDLTRACERHIDEWIADARSEARADAACTRAVRL
jgi:hypothetical protein